MAAGLAMFAALQGEPLLRQAGQMAMRTLDHGEQAAAAIILSNK
jgi:hypothetical protein